MFCGLHIFMSGSESFSNGYGHLWTIHSIDKKNIYSTYMKLLKTTQNALIQKVLYIYVYIHTHTQQ